MNFNKIMREAKQTEFNCKNPKGIWKHRVKNLCRISVSKTNFVFMLEDGQRETVASGIFSQNSSLAALFKEVHGIM